MQGVRVVCADYREYLRRMGDDSFDVVLFDPMFRQTVTRSSALQALKMLANPEPLIRSRSGRRSGWHGNGWC